MSHPEHQVEDAPRRVRPVGAPASYVKAAGITVCACGGWLAETVRGDVFCLDCEPLVPDYRITPTAPLSVIHIDAEARGEGYRQ